MSTKFFKESERRLIIEEYLKGNSSKTSIWRHYTGQLHERGQLRRWMRQLGYSDLYEDVVSLPVMKKPDDTASSADLKKKIKELEQQLLDSQLRAEAYHRMIEIAEKELKVSIRKKSNTK